VKSVRSLLMIAAARLALAAGIAVAQNQGSGDARCMAHAANAWTHDGWAGISNVPAPAQSE
jgi:hypothetical protein